MNKQSLKSLGIGVFAVVAIFAGLIGLLSLVTGTGPVEESGDRFVYKTVGDRELALWAYTPSDWSTNDRRVAVVWFFGGGWEVGSPWQFAEHSKWLAKRGVVSIVADYRIESTDGTSPFEAVKDARSALRWIRSNADKLGIDPDRIVAAGGSAGAHLAAGCAIFDEVNDESSDDLSISPVPDALWLFGPLLDRDIPIVRERTGIGEYESLVAISPIEQLQRPLPPTLILHGIADHIIPIESVKGFVARAKEIGSPNVHLVRHEGMGHEFYSHGSHGSHGSRGNREFKDSLQRSMEFLAELGWLDE